MKILHAKSVKFIKLPLDINAKSDILYLDETFTSFFLPASNAKSVKSQEVGFFYPITIAESDKEVKLD